MSNIAYFDVVNQIARAALSGTALPSISGKLLAHLSITAIFFRGDTVVDIDSGTAKCVIKDRLAPAGSPALLDLSAEEVVSGSETHYVFEWETADSVELRAFLDSQADPSQPVEMRCEIEYALDGEVERIAFPIQFDTSYSRPEDPAPSATSDTSWEWLKAREQGGDGITRTVDETAKTLTWSAPGIATNANAITTEAAARADADTTLQGNIDAEATSRAAADSTNATAITTEATARADADTTLQSNIDTEAATRAAADSTNATAITTEATARADADTTLQGNIDAEATARAAADTTLQNNINLKQDAASAFDGAYGSLSGVPTSFPPSSHQHPISDVEGLADILDGKLDQSQAFSGAYADLSGIPSDFAPSAHASSHKSGGADAIKLDELAAPTDVTTLNATTAAHGLLPKLGGGTTNFLRADGEWAAPAGGGGGGHTDVQVFTSDGTWTKPAGAVSVDLILVSGGAGGSSGARLANGITRPGGAGGGPGKYVSVNGLSAALFGATEAVTVGAGGAGGASVTTDDTNGNKGTAGGASAFGPWRAVASVVGSTFSTAATATASSCLFPLAGQAFSALVQSSGASGGTAAAPALLSYSLPTGGGGGGSLNSANSETAPGAGGGYNLSTFTSQIYTGATAAAAAGVNSLVGAPTNGANGGSIFLFCGMGGGGGGCARPTVNGGVSAPGANGGNGSLYGGGGGGGGCSENGFASGAGGNGAPGIVVVITHFA